MGFIGLMNRLWDGQPFERRRMTGVAHKTSRKTITYRTITPRDVLLRHFERRRPVPASLVPNSLRGASGNPASRTVCTERRFRLAHQEAPPRPTAFE